MPRTVFGSVCLLYERRCYWQHNKRLADAPKEVFLVFFRPFSAEAVEFIEINNARSVSKNKSESYRETRQSLHEWEQSSQVERASFLERTEWVL